MAVRGLNRRSSQEYVCYPPCMSSHRRVRFAEDPRTLADQFTPAAPQTARISKSTSQPPQQEFIESQHEETEATRAFETSRAEQLDNARLAAQRAHDAMMLARSMQADIRNCNAKLDRFGHNAQIQGKGPSPTKTSTTQPSSQLITRKDMYAGPRPELWREPDVISVPMTWIADLFLLVK